jgi:hypothetical protein
MDTRALVKTRQGPDRVVELSRKAAVKAGVTFERIVAQLIHEFALPIITRTRNDEVSTASRSDRSDVLCTSGDG